MVLDGLRDAGLGDVPVVVGGIIPDADAATLQRAGRRRGLHAQGLRRHGDHGARARRGPRRARPAAARRRERRVTETRVLVLRHGQSEGNVAQVWTSSLEGYPLTELGREQARAAGERLADRGVDGGLRLAAACARSRPRRRSAPSSASRSQTLDGRRRSSTSASTRASTTTRSARSRSSVFGALVARRGPHRRVPGRRDRPADRRPDAHGARRRSPTGTRARPRSSSRTAARWPSGSSALCDNLDAIVRLAAHPRQLRARRARAATPTAGAATSWAGLPRD